MDVEAGRVNGATPKASRGKRKAKTPSSSGRSSKLAKTVTSPSNGGTKQLDLTQMFTKRYSMTLLNILHSLSLCLVIHKNVRMKKWNKMALKRKDPKRLKRMAMD